MPSKILDRTTKMKENRGPEDTKGQGKGKPVAVVSLQRRPLFRPILYVTLHPRRYRTSSHFRDVIIVIAHACGRNLLVRVFGATS